MIFKNALKELTDSKNVYYGDELWILPYHLDARINLFSHLKRVSVTSVKDGINKKGCEVIGKIIDYDNNEFPINSYYSGYAIYRAKGEKVITQDGIYRIIYDPKQEDFKLTKEDFYRVYCKFYASDDLYIEFPLSGPIKLDDAESANQYSKKFILGSCFLYNDRLTCIINGNKFIFLNYCVIHKGIKYHNNTARQQLWNYMLHHETPYRQNEFGMDFSKEFKLKFEEFVIMKCSEE